MKTFQQFLLDINEAIEYVTGDETHKGYAADHGGGNYHDHIAFKDQKTRDAAREYLKKLGWEIGSQNDGKHATNSYHYSNQAFDIPMYRPSGKGVQHGFSDDKIGERAMSARLRADLIKGGYGSDKLGGGSTPTTPTSSVSSTPSKGSLDTPAKTKVLAREKGQTGELDLVTRKFTKRDWSDTEGSRYKAFGGKDPSPTTPSSPATVKPIAAKPVAAKLALTKPVATKPAPTKPTAKESPKTSKTA